MIPMLITSQRAFPFVDKVVSSFDRPCPACAEWIWGGMPVSPPFVGFEEADLVPSEQWVHAWCARTVSAGAAQPITR